MEPLILVFVAVLFLAALSVTLIVRKDLLSGGDEERERQREMSRMTRQRRLR